MDIGLPKQQSDLPDSITSPYAIWVRDALEVAYDQVRQHSSQAVNRQKRLYDRRAVKRLFAVGDLMMRYNTPAKKCKLDSAWIGPYLIVSLIGWALGIQKDSDSPIVMVHCQDFKKFPPPPGAIIDCTTGASTMQRTSQSSPSLTVAAPKEQSSPMSIRIARLVLQWLLVLHRVWILRRLLLFLPPFQWKAGRFG